MKAHLMQRKNKTKKTSHAELRKKLINKHSRQTQRIAKDFQLLLA